MTSTPTGWRAAKPEQSAALDALLTSAEFTAKPTPVFPCPDYGSATLIYRAPPVGRVVRSAACPGVIDRIVTAALEA